MVNIVHVSVAGRRLSAPTNDVVVSYEIFLPRGSDVTAVASVISAMGPPFRVTLNQKLHVAGLDYTVEHVVVSTPVFLSSMWGFPVGVSMSSTTTAGASSVNTMQDGSKDSSDVIPWLFIMFGVGLCACNFAGVVFWSRHWCSKGKEQVLELASEESVVQASSFDDGESFSI